MYFKSTSFHRSAQRILIPWVFILSTLPSPCQQSSKYSFFVAGHTYGEPGTDNAGFHPPFKAAFDYIRNHDGMQLGVLVGDIVSSQPTSEDWDEIDSDLALLELPVYFAAGNHDVEDRALFEERYGPTYYSFTFHNDLFIILDPNLDSWNISGPQLDFLRRVIKETHRSVDNIFVFFHQILWREDNNQFRSISWNSAAGKQGISNFWPEVMPIFENLANEVVMFAGDLGARWASDIMYHHCENITFVATGMGAGKGDNFVIANVAESKNVTFELICIGDVDRDCLGRLEDHTVGKCTEISQDEMIIYPNPTFDWVSIKLEKSEESVIELFDLSGNLIYTEKWIGYKKEIDLSGLPSSLYLIRLTTKDEIRHKIISKI